MILDRWSNWGEAKRVFSRCWKEASKQSSSIEALSWKTSSGRRTEAVIGSSSLNGSLSVSAVGSPVLREVLRQSFGDGDAWYQQQVFSVDTCLLQIDCAEPASVDCWGRAFSKAEWKTLALIEHENTLNAQGVVPSVRKLMDYSSGILRVAIGYATEDPAQWTDKWRNVLSVPGESLESLILVVGRLERAKNGEWTIFEAQDGRLAVLG